MNGASNVGWNENEPADTENAGLGDDRMRSIKTSSRAGLDDEHNWPAAGGSNVGYHRLGTARPFYGTQSRVSSSGTDGRLMLTSDTSRLFGVGSGGTVLLGGPTVLSMGTFPSTLPQRHHWAMETGVSNTGAGTTDGVQVTIPNSGFSGVPFVVVSSTSTAGGSQPLGEAFSVWSMTATTFYTGAVIVASGAFRANAGFNYISIGSRAL